MQGTYGASRNGTELLIASTWSMASKSLHPIPFDSFTDPEARLRRRSTDLLVHPDQMQNLRLRTAVIKALRARLDAEGFLEGGDPDSAYGARWCERAPVPHVYQCVR